IRPYHSLPVSLLPSVIAFRRRLSRRGDPMGSTRIAILSDDRLLREGVRRILAGEPAFQVVLEDESSSCDSLVRSARPDVALVDIRMDGALVLCAKARQAGFPAVILMAAADGDAGAIAALE